MPMQFLPFRQPSVLVVDDEPMILELMTIFLGERFDVITAGNANQALRVLADRTVDCVISDLHMPGMLGDALLTLIRQTTPSTRTILHTASDRDGETNDCDLTIIKPTGFDEIAVQVAALLEDEHNVA